MLSPLPAVAEEPGHKLHLVIWGETLSSIALLYDVSVIELMQANGLTNAHLIQAGQVLIIPTDRPAPIADPPLAQLHPSSEATHVVAPGESLYAIALYYGVDLSALAAANGIANPHLIQPGQVLSIPRPGTEAPSSGPADVPSAGERYHDVRAGETLLGIALEYGVSLEALQAANTIINPSIIQVGLRLRIPTPGETRPTAAEPAPSAPSSVEQPRGMGNALGVCVHLFEQDADAVLTAVHGLGFDWAKQQVEWKLFEPHKGQIDWPALDEVVDAAERHGRYLLLSVVKAPLWSRPADTDPSVDGPPADPRDYGDFLEALATRYRGRVAAYEIWNEQNLWYEWGGKGKLSAGEYVALLREAYSRLKAADPNAIVVSGGLTPTGVNDGYLAFDDVHYLGQMYALGAAPYFDALGAHSAGYNNPPDDTPERNTSDTTQFKGHWSFYFLRFRQLRDVMLLHGDAHKQVWLTEFGWSSQMNPPEGYEYAADNSEEEQARYLLRAIQIATQNSYVGPMFVWNLNYASVVGPIDEKAGFSLVRADGSARPAYLVLLSMPK